MTPPVIYSFRQGGAARSLLFRTVTDCLYTMLLDFHHARATPEAVEYNGRRLYDAAALQRIYAACRAELLTTNEQVPTQLEAVARRELQRLPH
jgi:hypothetical protein